MYRRSAQELRNRLDALVDGWQRTAPEDRIWLVVEKIRLEHELDELRLAALPPEILPD